VFKVDRFALVIFTIIDSVKIGCARWHANIFTTLCSEVCRHFIFDENGFIGTFGDACTAIDACVRVDVIPRPLVDGHSRNNALHRTNLNTSGVAKA
jgi:hypothetical protein